jgi:hypothetical protein
MAATTDACCICLIDGKLSPSIEWNGAPTCRKCLAEAIEENGSSCTPLCRGLAKREPQPAASPSLGISCATIQ